MMFFSTDSDCRSPEDRTGLGQRRARRAVASSRSALAERPSLHSAAQRAMDVNLGIWAPPSEIFTAQ